MNWAKAVEINRQALNRIIVGLLLLVGFPEAEDQLPGRVSQDTYRKIARALLPAESALRRLIVMAARGLVVPVPVKRPMTPEQAARLAQHKRSGSPTSRALSFRLFDKRRSLSFDDPKPKEPAQPAQPTPRIWVIDAPDPRSPLFLNQQQAASTPDDRSTAAFGPIGRRLLAIKRALDSIPHQARRMARWQARRAAMENPPFLRPMRPGPAPGHIKRSQDDLMLILRECHALAWHALSQPPQANNTS